MRMDPRDTVRRKYAEDFALLFFHVALCRVCPHINVSCIVLYVTYGNSHCISVSALVLNETQMALWIYWIISL